MWTRISPPQLTALDIVIQVPPGDFALGAEPHIREPFGVTNALFEDADDVRSPAYVRVDYSDGNK